MQARDDDAAPTAECPDPAQSAVVDTRKRARQVTPRLPGVYRIEPHPSSPYVAHKLNNDRIGMSCLPYHANVRRWLSARFRLADALQFILPA